MNKKYFTSAINVQSALFLTCEHASRVVPPEYPPYLGMTPEEFENAKDVDDPGAAALTHDLTRVCACSTLEACYSRAVIDVNRQLVDNPTDIFHASALKRQLLTVIAGEEKIVDVPANPDDPEEERRRFDEFAVPYQAEAARIVGELRQSHDHIFLVQIHSYFRQYNGQRRDTDIGILFRKKYRAQAELFQGFLREKAGGLRIDLNVPYDIAEPDSLRAAMDQFEQDDDVTVLIVEVSNDLLVGDHHQYAVICESLHYALERLIAS